MEILLTLLIVLLFGTLSPSGARGRESTQPRRGLARSLGRYRLTEFIVWGVMRGGLLEAKMTAELVKESLS